VLAVAGSDGHGKNLAASCTPVAERVLFAVVSVDYNCRCGVKEVGCSCGVRQAVGAGEDKRTRARRKMQGNMAKSVQEEYMSPAEVHMERQVNGGASMSASVNGDAREGSLGMGGPYRHVCLHVNRVDAE